MKKKKRGGFWKPFFILLSIIIGLFIISSLLTKDVSLDSKVALIPIEGAISSTGLTGLIPSKGVSSNEIISYIDQANADSGIKAILFEINSPGGTVVASSEIAAAIKRTEKPTIALIKDTAASGAYWIASASDIIIANPMSITGSLGVIGSYLEFSDLFEEYGIKYQRLVTGKYKDIGTPYKKLTSEEEKLMQRKLNKIHNYFVKEISDNRERDLSFIANGMFYLGEEALKLGLVDYLGNKELAINLTKEKLGVKKIKLIKFEKKKSLVDVISKLFSNFGFYVGSGIGSSLITEAKSSNFEIIV